ncbi:MAG: hypothetical protein R6U89_05120 [Dehalococcoidia bacterium]
MVRIYFAGPYPPIMCGIAAYTHYLTRVSPAGRWGVISFDPERYEAPLTNEHIPRVAPVCYALQGKRDFHSDDIRRGLEELNAVSHDGVLWFQHETAIWRNQRKFISMIKNLDMPKVVTMHTLHFQSNETPTGLRSYQYSLLEKLLPHVDAITVFSYGVYWAVISAFPEHCTKVYVLKHGVHNYPDVTRLSRQEAREELEDFLIHASDLNQTTKRRLRRRRIFSDPDVAIIGQTGFLCPLKRSESLYAMRENLQRMLPWKRIIAVRIGKPRDESHSIYAEKLKMGINDPDAFLLNTWLSDEMLATAQRAFDVNFYWPSECTQSGILAHALGAGGVIASRDLEGVGEALKGAGEMVDTDIDSLTTKIADLIAHPDMAVDLEEKALRYAHEFSWMNQVRRHYDLAEAVSAGTELQQIPAADNQVDPMVALVTGDPRINPRTHYPALRKLLEDIHRESNQRETV